jgi:signal transduction histidine kinase
VLGFLCVTGESLMAGPKPIIVLASPGHIDSFREMLPRGRSRCIPFEPRSELPQRTRDAVAELLFHAPAPLQTPGNRADASVALAAKRVAADCPHSFTSGRRRRHLLDRQVRFVSDIAHDLRTPLTAICEFAHLMGAGVVGEMNAEQRRYVSIIERRCDEAARMVYDLLDGARLQSGRIHPHRQSIDIGDVFRDVEESMEPAIRHSEVRLRAVVAEGLPRVFADRDMIARIVANLVSNAIKFSPPQGMVSLSADKQSVSMARVSVVDSGSGISPEDLRRIFRRFEQGSNSACRGAGLGLSIVRELVRLHGGRITVESAPGKGSRFQFTLPLYLPVAILRGYLARLSKMRNAAATAWSVSCPDPAKYDPIHRLISATVRARDLVLPADNRCHILLVTQARRPERLIARLERQLAAYNSAVPVIGRLELGGLKMWLERLPGEPYPRDVHIDLPQLAG